MDVVAPAAAVTMGGEGVWITADSDVAATSGAALFSAGRLLRRVASGEGRRFVRRLVDGLFAIARSAVARNPLPSISSVAQE